MVLICKKGTCTHMHLKAALCQFCCFHWDGKVYRYKVMPFGLSIGPDRDTFLRLHGSSFACTVEGHGQATQMYRLHR